MYKEYKQLNLSQVGKDVLEFWKANNIFEKSITSRPESKPYTFYEGPPSANGMPGIHHVMARSIKDIFCRYKTLKGYQVKRKGGWDTHGLPIELGVEKSLGITKDDIGKKISIEDYNAACRKEVMKYTDVWNDLTEKMGYWVDLTDPYITYKNEYIETLWWILKELYNKDMLYKGYTVQPYSPKSGTGLSSHELNQPGAYQMIKDTSVVAQFRIITDKSNFLFTGLTESPNNVVNPIINDVYFLAWTTTPWTLPSNSALAVGKKIDYVLVRTFNQYTFQPIYIVLAEDLLKNYFRVGESWEFNVGISSHLYEYVKKWIKEGNDIFRNELNNISSVLPKEFEEKFIKKKNNPYQIIKKFKGEDLEGIKYEQLMPYPDIKIINDNAFKVILGDFVTTGDGTGIVHIAPTFGSDDFRVAKENNIPSVMVTDETGKEVPLVNKQGRFVDEVTDFAGLYVKEEYYTKEEREAPGFKGTDVLISIKLKTENKAFDVKKYEHSYPHSWRTDEPILYYPLDSWFIRTTAVKDKLVALNKTINWKPESTGTGRFGNWLENLVDWNLSRSRFWGTPLPIWRTKNAYSEDEYEICIGSIKQLRDYKQEEKNGYTISQWAVYVDLKKFDKEFDNSNLLIKDALEDRWNSLLIKANRFGADNIEFFYDFLHLIKPQYIDDILTRYSVNLQSLWIEDDKIDLHRPYVDNILIVRKRNLNVIGETDPNFYSFYKRELDLIDVWFDSGAMPYAQWHFPFENKKEFANAYPADFIAEGVDQTRGWFFTLHAIAVMLSESSDEIKAVNKEVGNKGVAFKNVVSNGLVLDKNGNKMSKRLGNAVDPFSTIEQYGADAARWYMISNASPWDNLKFNTEGIDEVRRKFFGTLYNTYVFFITYANIDQFTYSEADVSHNKRPQLDRWILSLLNTLVENVDEFYADFEPTKAARAIEEFVDKHLSNWYVRLSRRRFWRSDNSDDKLPAYQTLYTCLVSISKLMSPIAPFFADRLYTDLNTITGKEKCESVHLADFPAYHSDLVNKALEERMQMAQDISSLVLSLRKKVGINVRQPLSRILLPILNKNFKHQVEQVKDLILSETNVKDIEYITDASGFIKKKVKPNFKALGPKVGKDMKAVAEAITNMSQDALSKFEETGITIFEIGNSKFEISLNDVEIIAEDVPGWQVASLGKLTVALDVNITNELKQEGISRELINRIQNLRKEKGFEVTDKITVQYRTDSGSIIEAIKNNLLYICAEILAVSIMLDNQLNEGDTALIDENEILIAINKI